MMSDVWVAGVEDWRHAGIESSSWGVAKPPPQAPNNSPTSEMISSDELLTRLHAVTGPELTLVPPASPWSWWIAVALIASLLCGIMLFWPHRRKALALSPEIEARRALDSLASQPTSESLSMFDRVVRAFIRHRHMIEAERLTTPELLAALPREVAVKWAEVLQPCDHAHYSGTLPTQAAYAAMVRCAATLI